MFSVDVKAGLDLFYAATRIERDAPEEPHVADLSNCDRAVWARRNREPLLAFSTRELRRFAQGHRIEAEILDALDFYGKRQAKPWYVERGVRVALWASAERVHGRIIESDEDYSEAVEVGCMIGHIDGVVRSADDHCKILSVLEVKSTLFFEKREADGSRVRAPGIYLLKDQYLMQAAAYALAIGAPTAQIIISCYASHEIAPSVEPYVFDPTAWDKRVRERLRAVSAITAPGTPMAPISISSSETWRCKFCMYSGCPNNVNPVRLEVPFDNAK